MKNRILELLYEEVTAARVKVFKRWHLKPTEVHLSFKDFDLLEGAVGELQTLSGMSVVPDPEVPVGKCWLMSYEWTNNYELQGVVWGIANI